MRPPSFTVLGKKYAVKTYAHITNDDNDSLRGDVDHEFGVVRLSTHLSDETSSETLLHEALHAMVVLAGLSSKLDYDDQEDVVNRISPILWDFLRKNPAVYTYITGRYTRHG